jgi:hypothetical protein
MLLVASIANLFSPVNPLSRETRFPIVFASAVAIQPYEE